MPWDPGQSGDLHITVEACTGPASTWTLMSQLTVPACSCLLNPLGQVGLREHGPQDAGSMSKAAKQTQET